MANMIPMNVFNSIGDTDTKSKLLEILKSTQPVISDSDKQIGVKTRYFARYQAHRNGNIYEISESDYNTIEQNGLFQKTKIDWIIRGRLEDIALTIGDGSTILIKGVISQNQTLLAIASETMPGIMQHLQNHMEYWAGE